MFGSALRYYASGALSLTIAAAAYMLYPERTLSYDQPPRLIYDALRQTGAPPLVFGETTTTKIIVNSPSSLTWSVQENGKEMMRYTATLIPEGEGRTRVALDFRTGAKADALRTAERLDQVVTIRKLYLTAIKERIASSIEGRNFNLALIYPMTIVAGIAHQGELLRQVDAYSRQEEDRATRNIRKAYAEGDR